MVVIFVVLLALVCGRRPGNGAGTEVTWPCAWQALHDEPLTHPGAAMQDVSSDQCAFNNSRTCTTQGWRRRHRAQRWRTLRCWSAQAIRSPIRANISVSFEPARPKRESLGVCHVGSRCLAWLYADVRRVQSLRVALHLSRPPDKAQSQMGGLPFLLFREETEATEIGEAVQAARARASRSNDSALSVIPADRVGNVMCRDAR